MPDPDDEPLADSFTAVARLLRMRTRETVAPFGVTPGQARALSIVQRHGAMRISDLSSHLRIAPRSATEVVDALEERGLIERSSDPQDRRAVVLTLAPEGLRIARALRETRAEEAEAFFSKLSSGDRGELARILGILRQA
jgi:DNA-binding MarR family transcriptional regulator